MRTAVPLGTLCLVLFIASCTAPASSPTAAPPVATSSPSATSVPAGTRTPFPAPTRTPTASRTSTPAPTVTRAPTATPTVTRVPVPAPAFPRPAPPSSQNSKNGLFDVVVIVDKASPDVAKADVTRVFETAATQMAAHTGEWMRLVEVVYGMSRETSGDQFAQMQNLALAYLKANQTNPPDGILIFSDTYTARCTGGFSLHFKPGFAYQNEYKSPRPEVGGGNVYVAVVEYAHPYARCGYGADLYDRTRKGEVSSDGECRNRSGITCVLSQESWVCPDSLRDLNADRDYFIGSIITHEFLHPFGIDAADLNQDHFASTSCIKRGGVTAAQADALMNDVWESQVNLGFCPDVFARFRR